MWPIVQKLFSLVAIGGKSKGLELFGRIGGYLVPLVNQLLTSEISGNSSSPLAVIICPDWEVAQIVANGCSELGKDLLANDGKTFEVGCIFANEIAHAVKLTNGCHVLVTTPNSLLRMLDPGAKITNLDRCTHLIFERADECFEKFHMEVKDIMKMYLKAKSCRKDEKSQVCLIISKYFMLLSCFICFKSWKTFVI